MIHRLVFENLKHRPVRTLLSVIAIGVEVTLILTLVGLSRGVLGDMAARSRGTGADILIRPPESSGFTFSYTMPEKIVNVVRAQPHVAMATGTFVKYIDSFSSITGIHLEEFNAMSGGLKLIKGRLFQDPDDLVVDEVFAQQHHLKPGSTIDFGHAWRVSGIVEQGKLSRTFTDIARAQELYSAHDLVSTIYVKLDDPANTRAVIGAFQKQLPTYKVDSIEDFVSLFSTNSVPYIEAFTKVVIGVAVLIGFLVVCLSMYTAVLERTREIGILKALGASPAYIVGILMRETVLLALVGTAVGILMTYGTRALMATFAASMPQEIVPDWYLTVTGIALAGSVVGALYPGLRAARQDAIEALAYD
ncbi:MAG: ABC transporter permease [Acidobacteriia bacterium]|nr:ABC transporter permease [Terriglobia bacterium]